MKYNSGQIPIITAIGRYIQFFKNGVDPNSRAIDVGIICRQNCSARLLTVINSFIV